MLSWEILKPEFKGVMQIDYFIMRAMMKLTEGRFSTRIRKEVLYVDVCGLRFVRHHHFTGIFDLKLQQLFTAGIVPHYHEAAYSQSCSPGSLREGYNRIRDGESKQFNMRMLEPGFVIWIASLSLTLIAFIFESLVTLKDFLVFRYILLAFYKERFMITNSNSEGNKSAVDIPSKSKNCNEVSVRCSVDARISSSGEMLNQYKNDLLAESLILEDISSNSDQCLMEQHANSLDTESF